LVWVFLSSTYCSQCVVDVEGSSVESYCIRAVVKGLRIEISLAPYSVNRNHLLP
jgi:hypothetical protein